MIDHIWRPVADYERSKLFYTTLLLPLGYQLLRDHPEKKRAGFGIIDKDGQRDFWVIENLKEAKGSSYCLAFAASSKSRVDEFWNAGIRAGGRDNGKPGYRKEYGDGYYAAFIFDPDGYNIEAVFDDKTSM